jgi:hypothetical protein
MHRRTLFAVAGWLAAAMVAALIGVGALRLVGQSIAGTPVDVLSRQEVDRALASAAPSGTPARSSSPAPPSPSPSLSASAGASPTSDAVRRVLTGRGGSVVAECRGSVVRLVSWAPNQGFAVHEAEPGPAAEADVDFRGVAGRSKIKAWCAGGEPVGEDDGDSGGNDDDSGGNDDDSGGNDDDSGGDNEGPGGGDSGGDNEGPGGDDSGGSGSGGD